MQTTIALLPLIAVLGLALACGELDARGELFTYDSKTAFRGFVLTNARWDAASGGVAADGADAIASVETPDIPVTAGFDQLIVSWNASTPAGGYLTFFAKARTDGAWTDWYNMGLWNRDGCPQPRTSLKGQKDDLASVDTDTLILKKRADAFRVRVEMSSVDGAPRPVLRFLAVNVTDGARPAAGKPVKNVWGTELDVPELCQLSAEGGSGWCSPTSTAMVLGYWSKKLGRPELSVGITETARAVYDEAWRGTGNWVFNTAHAGEFDGIRAYVTRFEGVPRIEAMIARGVPVIVSVNYNKLNRRSTTRTMGHLMVIRGFTADGDPIFNDPWARMEKGEKVRKVFKRKDLEDAWLGPSRGTVYLVYPVGWNVGSVR